MGEQKFLLIMPEGSRGHVKLNFFDKLDKHSAPNGAIKVERGPKEDERVGVHFLALFGYKISPEIGEKIPMSNISEEKIPLF